MNQPGAARKRLRNSGRWLIGAGIAAAILAQPTLAQDALLDGFRDPPDSARPRVWWHWISGNVSQDGITKDLEWMKRAGLAGAMMFDGDMGAPQIVPKRVTVLSPAWYDNLRFAAKEADRLGLEFAMAAGPGWSETGGPWVRPEQAMKKFVWSETRLSGGKPAGRIAPLPDVPGPFQQIAREDLAGSPEVERKPFARDIAVLAFRAPAGDVALSSLGPLITTSAPEGDVGLLTDGRLTKKLTLPEPERGAPAWVRYSFAAPHTMRALTYAGPLAARFSDGPQGRVEASDDGVTWRTLRTLTGPGHNPAPQRTFAFPETTARHFRVVFERGMVSREPFELKPGIPLAELALVPGARVEMFEEKAGFGVMPQAGAGATPAVSAGAAIRSSGILDLTGRLRPDGTLDWTPPSGDWIVLRTGWSLTGAINHPATPEGTGLEVDKLNAEHVRAHLDAYMTPVIRALDGFAGDRGLRYLLTDSWEAGQENWTEPLPAEFRKRRGYDLAPHLPTLAGYVVDDAKSSDAFLWDFRRTLADLLAENHYGTITRFAREHGLGYYGEATGAARPTVADGMQAKSLTDIPMGEYWAMPFGAKPGAFHNVRTDEFPADIIETRSTAHVYGKPLVAAEALTSSQPQWASTPWKLKWVADKYMAMGVNRHVLHTSPHQPSDEHKPGLTLGPFGQVFTRHETWAGMARPWIDYLARSSFLLQQGEPVADVLYFYGEGAPSGVSYDIPGWPADLKKWGFDYVNADALLRLATVSGGRIVFPGGASYRLLVLPREDRHMTLPMITRLRELVAQGAVLAGPRPLGSPSLSSDDAAVRALADEVWGAAGEGALAPHRFGKGRVYENDDVEAVLAAENVAADFSATIADSADLRFAHRRLAGGDLYFVTNQSASAATVPVRFRVAGRTPEAWDAADGSIRPLSYRQVGEATEVPLTLGAWDSLFVVFRKAADAPSRAVPVPMETALAALDKGWTLRFPADSPAGKREYRVDAGSWTRLQDAEARYFSGVAVYSRTVEARPGWFGPGRRIYLDLGSVGDIAEVSVNGSVAGTAWKPPYRVDVTGQLRPGQNRIEIRVANTWQNRFVGDKQPGARPQAWTNLTGGGAFGFLSGNLTADTPLTPSGLLGAIRLLGVDQP